MNDQYKSVPVKSSEITPHSLYLSRRDFLKAAGIVTGTALLAACAPSATGTAAPAGEAGAPSSSNEKDELGDPVNTLDDISHYNNYYEFTTDKQGVAKLAEGFTTDPWSVQVYGLVNKPTTFAMEDLLSKFTQEERIYRLRCVEAWSMVIPWTGFSLASLLKEVEPTSDAKYVRFESVYRPEEMPGLKSPFYTWPYQEGLRIDEAMNELAILATGLYGQPLPKSNGAPVRLVVPWKYGFKSIKAVVKIELVADQPSTLWNDAAPNEYGFYSNVKSKSSAPALVTGHRTARRRIGTPSHLDVQWLRRSGSFSLPRHGPG